MIKKYQCGKPFPTDAVIESVTAEPDLPEYLHKIKEGYELSLSLNKEDVIYGLGENVRGINKRGWVYESYCTDQSAHREDVSSLYGAHNFFLIDGAKKTGYFLDYPGKVRFDLGYTCYDKVSVTLEDNDFVLYVITEETSLEVIQTFRKLIGQSYIPPKWAFGYGQSRWSYYSEEEVRGILKAHRENQVPLDSIYLDIDYMDHYKDFTINNTTFPNFDDFVKEMKAAHIHLVPIIDAGVKIEDGYAVYEEGKNKNFFCKNEDGTDFVGGVWPGRVHFPDFLNKEVREWFGALYEKLIALGIDGFWNDMNEPALFYSEANQKMVFEKMKDFEGKNMDLRTFFAFTGLITSLHNNPKDHELFYHTVDGTKYRHDKLHNLYGYNMTKAAGEEFNKKPQRILLFSRSSYIGMHRYGGIWMGDNLSWWSHIELCLKMLPSLNMCGFLYTGADLGGFGANTTEDLLLRFLELGIFTPLMRNHSALRTRPQEVTRFSLLPEMKKIICLRYALLPYLYSEYMKAAVSNTLMFVPLGLAYPKDNRAREVEDELLCGDSIMIAPVYKQNVKGRYVYLPEPMRLLRFRSITDYDSEYLSQGDHYVRAELNEVLIFVRPQKLLILSKGGQTVDEVDDTDLSVFAYRNSGSYLWYRDDGLTKDYENKENYVTITVNDGNTKCSLNTIQLGVIE